jgi:hypothetical protein
VVLDALVVAGDVPDPKAEPAWQQLAVYFKYQTVNLPPARA